jgi:hypothetical protein
VEWLIGVKIRKAEVDQLDGRAAREKQILRLEIAVDDVLRMQIVNGKNNLFENPFRKRFFNASARRDKIEQLSASAILEDNIVRGVVFDKIVTFDDPRVVQIAQAGDALDKLRALHR